MGFREIIGSSKFQQIASEFSDFIQDNRWHLCFQGPLLKSSNPLGKKGSRFSLVAIPKLGCNGFKYFFELFTGTITNTNEHMQETSNYGD